MNDSCRLKSDSLPAPEKLAFASASSRGGQTEELHRYDNEKTRTAGCPRSVVE
jgi:hypothetical protein